MKACPETREKAKCFLDACGKPKKNWCMDITLRWCSFFIGVMENRPINKAKSRTVLNKSMLCSAKQLHYKETAKQGKTAGN